MPISFTITPEQEDAYMREASVNSSKEGKSSLQDELAAVRIRTGGKTHSINMDAFGTGEAPREKVSSLVQVTESDLRPVHDFLDTGRSPSGIVQARSELTPESIVNWNGMEVSLRNLELQGLVTRNPVTGLYELPDGGSQSGKAGETKGDASSSGSSVPADHEGYLGEEVEGTLSTLIKGSPELAGSLYNAAIEAAASTGVIEFDYDAIGYALGLSPQAAETAMERVVSAFQGQMDRFAAASEVYDVTDFTEWARTTSPTMVREAMAKMLDRADMSGWRALAGRYKDSGRNISNDDLLYADWGEGAQVWQAKDGRIWVNSAKTGTMEARKAYMLADAFGGVYWG